MSIAVCMIVKNEEKNIVGCLESVESIADELIIVDNGCTDDTLEILKSYKCQVIDGGHFELDSARSLYLSAAKSEWLFLIDADERFEPKDSQKLRELLLRQDADTWGLQLNSIQYIGNGKWSDSNPLRIIRNNGQIVYNNSPIHASLAPSIYEKGKTILKLDVRLHHLDILIPKRTTNKRSRYKMLLKKELAKSTSTLNVDFYNLYTCFLALEYIAIKEYIQAEELLKSVSDSNTRYQYFAISLLCQMYIAKNEYHKVTQYITQKYEQVLIETEVMGNYLYENDRKRCLELYESEVINRPQKLSNFLNLAFLIKEKQPERARKLMKKVLSENDYLADSYIHNEGNQPNIFDVQSNVLKSLDSVLTLLNELKLGYLVEMNTQMVNNLNILNKRL